VSALGIPKGKAKLKVPRPQSHKQDEKLVSEFKKNSELFSIA